MVAYWADPDGGGNPKVLLETYARHLSFFQDVYEPACETYAINGLEVTTSTNPFGSDHMPFLDLGGYDNGVPGLLVIDDDYHLYPHYHKTTDTFDKVNEVIALDIIRMNIGAVARMSFNE